jgi:hypothetical protein
LLSTDIRHHSIYIIGNNNNNNNNNIIINNNILFFIMIIHHSLSHAVTDVAPMTRSQAATAKHRERLAKKRAEASKKSNLSHHCHGKKEEELQSHFL